MSLTIPYSFTGGPGNKALASQVNANFLAVAAKFTEGAGGISDADTAANAGFKGTKMSNIPGLRIPSDRIEDDAIGADQLRDDGTSGSPNAAVNTAAHVKDGIIPSNKLKATVSSHTPGTSISIDATRTVLASQFAPGIPNKSTAVILQTWWESANPTFEPKLSVVPVAKSGSLANDVVIANTSDNLPHTFAGEVLKALWINLT